MSDFAEALALVLAMEGGRVNDPRDPGGRTNKGITQRTYDAWCREAGHPRRTVYAITADEIECIYRDEYARPICFDQLPRGLGYAVFDAAVNSGPVRATRWLQATLGSAVTGHLNLATRAAVARAHPVPVIEGLCAARLGMLRHLAGWAPFGRGWSRRVDFVRSHALAMCRDKTPPACPAA